MAKFIKSFILRLVLLLFIFLPSIYGHSIHFVNDKDKTHHGPTQQINKRQIGPINDFPNSVTTTKTIPPQYLTTSVVDIEKTTASKTMTTTSGSTPTSSNSTTIKAASSGNEEKKQQADSGSNSGLIGILVSIIILISIAIVAITFIVYKRVKIENELIDEDDYSIDMEPNKLPIYNNNGFVNPMVDATNLHEQYTIKLEGSLKENEENEEKEKSTDNTNEMYKYMNKGLKPPPPPSSRNNQKKKSARSKTKSSSKNSSIFGSPKSTESDHNRKSNVSNKTTSTISTATSNLIRYSSTLLSSSGSSNYGTNYKNQNPKIDKNHTSVALTFGCHTQSEKSENESNRESSNLSSPRSASSLFNSPLTPSFKYQLSTYFTGSSRISRNTFTNEYFDRESSSYRKLRNSEIPMPLKENPFSIIDEEEEEDDDDNNSDDENHNTKKVKVIKVIKKTKTSKSLPELRKI